MHLHILSVLNNQSKFLPILFSRIILKNTTTIAKEGDVTKAICNTINGLTKEQREICIAHPDAMVAVGDGIRLAMEECQRQFREHRWNCTLTGKHNNSFGYVFLVGK